MSDPTLHLSPALLVRLAMDRPGGGEREAAEAHAATCPRCRAELEGVASARARFQARVFPRTREAVVARAASLPSRWRLAWPLGLVAAVGAAAVLLVVAPAPDPELRAKGASLAAFALRDGKVFEVAERGQLRPGDRLRFVARGGGAAFVLVASVDGRRSVSVYYPSTALPPGAQATELPDSILLDDAPGPERIFAVFSDRPVPQAEVVAALRGLAEAGPGAIRAQARLALPYPQSSLLVEKVETP